MAARRLDSGAWKYLSRASKAPVASAVQQDALVELGLMTVLQASRCPRNEAGRLIAEARGEGSTKKTKQFGHESEEYQAYMRSPEWMARSLACLESAKYKCQVCGGKATDAHHLTYIRFMRELPTDLHAVCRSCHQQIHGTSIAPNQKKRRRKNRK